MERLIVSDMTDKQLKIANDNLEYHMNNLVSINKMFNLLKVILNFGRIKLKKILTLLFQIV